ncbi:MAG: dihydroorotate dehydrogenase [Rhodobacteraceae bacterium]|nr:MAG: dihydroorotate dehydrogenase [Paracoccaceae bacterium]
MMMRKTEQTEPDRSLAAARDHAPQMPDTLRQRILADARAALPAADPFPAPGARQQWRLAWRWAVPGLAGAACATLAGFWIGAAVPLAPDAPVWALAALDYLDGVAQPLMGMADPLAMEF